MLCEVIEGPEEVAADDGLLKQLDEIFLCLIFVDFPDDFRYHDLAV